MERVETPRTGRQAASWVAGGTALLLAGAAAVAALFLTVPKGNEGSGPVDVLIVLGTPAGMYGELTPMEQWRVDEGVREYRRGRAPRLLFSGGPTSEQYVEADVMARYARQLGVPAEAILEDRRAMTTVQNVANSAAIVRSHGWNRVEVVSTAEHLRRASVLLEKTGLDWRVHVAPTPGRDRLQLAGGYAEEAFGTAVLRVFGTRAEPVLHLLARVQHKVAWCVRWVKYRV